MYEISKSIIGLDNILYLLKNSLLDKSLSNSMIFFGNKGIGKRTFTYFLINEIYNNLNNDKILSNHSNLIYNNVHPNVKLLQKEFDQKTNKLKNYITIDQIRNLNSFINQSSFDNLPKFIIIDSANDFNLNSSNAFLKILEEPKNNNYFILISHSLSSLLPTIRSRCLKLKFPNPTLAQYKKIILNVDSAIDISNLDYLYDLSQGSPGLSLELYSESINFIFDHLIEIFREKKSLSNKILELSSNVSTFNNYQFNIFLLLVKFILINTIKINLGVSIEKSFISDLSRSLTDLSVHINNNVALEILEYLKNYENDLFIYNLDKKFFCLNIFSPLSYQK